MTRAIPASLALRRAALAALAAVALVAAMPAAALAVTVTRFSENFNSYAAGTLDQKGPWHSFTLFGGGVSDFSVAAAYGTGGSLGAGGGSFTGDSASIGGTLSTGTIQLDLDMSWTTGTSNGPQYWLTDPVNSISASLQWDPSGGIHMEGLFGEAGHAHATGFSTGTLHTTLVVNLATRAVSYSWYDFNDPANNGHAGTVNLGSYAPTTTFAPSLIHIYMNAGATGVGGFDNIVLTQTVPEPASLALAGVAALAALGRARRMRPRAS